MHVIQVTLTAHLSNTDTSVYFTQNLELQLQLQYHHVTNVSRPQPLSHETFDWNMPLVFSCDEHTFHLHVRL